MPLRRGYALAEALCALVLGGLLLVVAGLALSHARRALEAETSRARGGRAEREAVHILRKALELGDGIIVRGDTAVELDLLLGVGVVCATEPHGLIVPTEGSSGLVRMAHAPGADDVAAVRVFEPSGSAWWWHGVLDSAQLRSPPPACGGGSGWTPATEAAQPAWRLVFRDSLPTGLTEGAEVRLQRRGRFALYHVGGGAWALGFRRCHPWNGVCGPIQPVVWPLRPPSAGGVEIRALAGPAGWSIRSVGVDGRGASAQVWP